MQYAIRDVDEALDALAMTAKKIRHVAGWKLAAAIKPQADELEKRLVDAAVALHNVHFEYFWNKRHLINNGIGIYTNFLSNIDDVVGIPVDNNSELAKLFREAVKAGHIKKMPEGLK